MRRASGGHGFFAARRRAKKWGGALSEENALFIFQEES